MKFMELDSDGFIHHIMDDPCICMLPVVNRFQHNDKEGNSCKDALGRPVSFTGARVLGMNPVDHPPELLPRSISDEDYAMLVKDGLSGYKDPAKRTARWAYKWDFDLNKAKKVDVL